MKRYLSVLFLLFPILFFSHCGDGSSTPQPTTSDLGTFSGSIQVSDDPQTALGYLLNAKATVSRKGSDVTVKIIGDPSFDRDYAGSVVAEVPQNNVYSISLKQQSKPTSKVVAGNLIIDGNSFGFDINVNNENINVIANGKTITLSGKLRILGTSMIRQ